MYSLKLVGTSTFGELGFNSDGSEIKSSGIALDKC